MRKSEKLFIILTILLAIVGLGADMRITRLAPLQVSFLSK